jgi:hypothetical protein
MPVWQPVPRCGGNRAPRDNASRGTRLAELVGMSSFASRPRVRRVFVLFLAVTAVAAVVTRPPSSSRYEALRDRVAVECRAFRADPAHAESPVCRDDGRHAVLPGLIEARRAWADAEQAMTGDGAAAALTRALVVLRVVQQDDTMLGILIAMTVATGTLDLIDAAHLSPTQRRAVFAAARFEIARNPFEPERLAFLSELADPESERAQAIPDLDDRAEAMAVADHLFTVMDAALAAGDVNTCISAAMWIERGFGGMCEAVLAARAVADRLRRAAARGA